MTIVVLVAGILATVTDPVRAEEGYKRFSLGHGYSVLTPAVADPKHPEPGVLTALYGLTIAKDFLPYVGTGLAYSIQPDLRPGDPASRIKTGVAGQAGFKFLFDDKTSLRLDYKYLYLDTNESRGDVKAPPHSLGLGLDIKF